MKIINFKEEFKKNTLALFKEQVKNFEETMQASLKEVPALKFEFNLNTIESYIKNTTQKPKIIMDGNAYLKMLSYVKFFDKEIAWKGTVERLDTYTFFIKDVFLYPQRVTNTYVESAPDEEVAEWTMNLSDEQYTELKFQGHSHVNMGVSPSSTDLTDQQNTVKDPNVISGEGSNAFYIFVIKNKKLEMNWFIHDFYTGLLYENSDIEFIIDYREEGYNSEELKKDIEKYAKPKVEYNYNNPNTYGWVWDHINNKMINVNSVKKDITELEFKTEKELNSFKNTKFFKENKNNLIIEYDKNFDIYFVMPRILNSPKWSEFIGSEEYKNLYEKKDNKSSKAQENKKLKEISSKIREIISKGSSAYIDIGSKENKFDEVNEDFDGIFEDLGKLSEITFNNGTKSLCYVLNNDLNILKSDLNLIALYELAKLGFKIKEIILKKG